MSREQDMIEQIAGSLLMRMQSIEKIKQAPTIVGVMALSNAFREALQEQTHEIIHQLYSAAQDDETRSIFLDMVARSDPQFQRDAFLRRHAEWIQENHPNPFA